MGKRCSPGTDLRVRVLNRFGETNERAACPVRQTLGQTAKFRQTGPEIGVRPGFAAYFGTPAPKRLSALRVPMPRLWAAWRVPSGRGSVPGLPTPCGRGGGTQIGRASWRGRG